MAVLDPRIAGQQKALMHTIDNDNERQGLGQNWGVVNGSRHRNKIYSNEFKSIRHSSVYQNEVLPTTVQIWKDQDKVIERRIKDADVAYVDRELQNMGV